MYSRYESYRVQSLALCWKQIIRKRRRNHLKIKINILLLYLFWLFFKFLCFIYYEVSIYYILYGKIDMLCAPSVSIVLARNEYLCTWLSWAYPCNHLQREIRRSGVITYGRLYKIHYFKHHLRWLIIAIEFKYYNIQPTYSCMWKEW